MKLAGHRKDFGDDGGLKVFSGNFVFLSGV